MTKVHIVTDGWHYRGLRYLEKFMVDDPVSSIGSLVNHWLAFQSGQRVGANDPELTKAGNELAAFFNIKPCYPAHDIKGA